MQAAAGRGEAENGRERNTASGVEGVEDQALIGDMRLQFENLERRDLLAGTYDWPAELGVAADVFVDGGARLSSLSLQSTTDFLGWTSETLLTSSSSKTRETIGGNAADLNGALLYPDGQARFPLLFVNGGKAKSHGSVLGESGRQAIRDFVNVGGSYTGSCAGAFLIGDYSKSVLNLWAGKMGVNGTGKQTVSFADWPDHPVSRFLVEHGIESLTVAGIPHIGGPRFSELYRHPNDTEFVGTIASGIAGGTSYLIEYRPTDESGLIVVQPSHPEYGRKPEHIVLSAAILDYAASQSQVTPTVKADLEWGQSAVMADATEKVGDSQYHVYTVTVPEGADRLAVALTGLGGNADLFVQYGGYAHELSYAGASTNTGRSADTVEIASPEPGVWTIGVRGTHTVLNGVAYTLTVGSELPEIVNPPPVPWAVLVFANGDNNFSGIYSRIAKTQLRNEAAANPNIAVAVQLDTTGPTTRHVYVGADVYQETIPEANMGSPEALSEFLAWGKASLPEAEHYAVVVLNHGSGWTGMSSDRHPRDKLTLPELDQGLSGLGRTIDVLHLDACLMQYAEVGYQLRDKAEYVVAAQTTDNVDRYTGRYAAVTADTTPAEFAMMVVDHRRKTKGDDGSAIYTPALDALATSMSGLMSAINESDALKAIKRAIGTTGRRDLGSLLTRLSRISDASVQASVSVAQAALADAVFYQVGSLSGLSIQNPRRMSDAYRLLEWSQDTLWDEINA